MKVYHQTEEDASLEIQQLQHELAALEISITRKKLRLSELKEDQGTNTRIDTGKEDRYHHRLYVDDRVKVLSSSKNKTFIANQTEAVVTGVTPQKQIRITDITNPRNKTTREGVNLERLFDQDE